MTSITTGLCSERYSFDTLPWCGLYQEKRNWDKAYGTKFPLAPVIVLGVRRFKRHFVQRMVLYKNSEEFNNATPYTKRCFFMFMAVDYCGRDITNQMENYLQHTGSERGVPGLGLKNYVLLNIHMHAADSEDNPITSREVHQYYTGAKITHKLALKWIAYYTQVYLDAKNQGGGCSKDHCLEIDSLNNYCDQLRELPEIISCPRIAWIIENYLEDDDASNID